jgi:hypothetical protein
MRLHFHISGQPQFGAFRSDLSDRSDRSDRSTFPDCGSAPRPPARVRAFTILELLLSISLMTVIIIGLYTVFNQTQRALRGTMSQVDVLENVRATSDLVVRDIEGAVPVRMANTNLTSMAVAANPVSVPVDLQGLAASGLPLLRTDIQDLYFVKKQNDFYTAIGYWVGPPNTNQLGRPLSVGRLYRFNYETNSAAFAVSNLFTRFASVDRLATSHPVMDGVVHFRMVAYDAAGFPLLLGDESGDMNKATFRGMPASSLGFPRSWFPDPARPSSTAYHFRRFTYPRFPAYLELEIGVLEPQVVTRYNAIPAPAEARKYLARNAGKIHLFRHRIPLRNSPSS